jgi:predicted dehydrogenase
MRTCGDASRVTSATSLRAGVVGGGDIARKAHLPVYRDDERVNLVALAERDADRRASVAREFGVDRTYEEGVDLVAEEDLDLVSICTPVQSHEELFTAAAERGRAVFCVKPFATTLESAQRMQAVAERNDCVTQIGYLYRFTRNFQRVLSVADNHLLGDLLSVNTVFHSRSPPMSWYYDKPDPGGGVVKRIFSHHIDFYLELFGRRPRVERATVRSVKTDGIEDFADVALDFGDVTVSATLSDTQQSYAVHHNQVVGAEGVVEFDQETLSGDVRGNLLAYERGQLPVVDAVLKRFWGRTEDDYHQRRVKDFLDHVADDDSETAAPVSRGVAVSQVQHDIYEAAGVLE